MTAECRESAERENAERESAERELKLTLTLPSRVEARTRAAQLFSHKLVQLPIHPVNEEGRSLPQDSLLQLFTVQNTFCVANLHAIPVIIVPVFYFPGEPKTMLSEDADPVPKAQR